MNVMTVLIDDLTSSATTPIGSLGGAQEEILYSVMKIIHRQSPAAVRAAASSSSSSEKVLRLSCCCRISELIPLVRQLHDHVRAMSAEAAPSKAA